MERAYRQTVTLGPGGAFEGKAPGAAEGTRDEVIVPLSDRPTADLAPGEYARRFSYRFRPEFHANRLRRSGPRPELDPAGRALYRRSWVGEVAATVPLTVRAA